ncbi:unnamed protein product [Eretmochelys imbricata]
MGADARHSVYNDYLFSAVTNGTEASLESAGNPSPNQSSVSTHQFLVISGEGQRFLYTKHPGKGHLETEFSKDLSPSGACWILRAFENQTLVDNAERHCGRWRFHFTKGLEILNYGFVPNQKTKNFEILCEGKFGSEGRGKGRGNCFGSLKMFHFDKI